MTKEDQNFKARLGAIGENNVASILMQNGWDAFNANASIVNYKSIDIICTKSPDISTDKPWKPASTFIQVKTSCQTSFPIGFSIENCLDKKSLEREVVGPYIFVLANNTDEGMTFRYFVLSRRQFIDLAYESHQFYAYGYKRDKSISLKSPAALCLRWLEGKSDPATDRHEAFHNPLKGVSSENQWNNIWIED